MLLLLKIGTERHAMNDQMQVKLLVGFIGCVCENLNVRLTCQVEDAIAGADVGQEGVPQALAGVGAFHQASNVHHIEECWDFTANQEGSLSESLFINKNN